MATKTIVTTAGQDARIAAAFGKELGLPGNANGNQVWAEIWNYVRAVVRKHETAAAVAPAVVTAEAGITDVGQPT